MYFGNFLFPHSERPANDFQILEETLEEAASRAIPAFKASSSLVQHARENLNNSQELESILPRLEHPRFGGGTQPDIWVTRNGYQQNQKAGEGFGRRINCPF